MRVALVGSVSSSVAALRALRRGSVEIAGVLGLDPAASSGVSDYADLSAEASAANALFQPFRKVTEPAVREFLERVRADILFAIGLSQLLPSDLMALCPAGGVGYHPTPLPLRRGRAPIVWTILLDAPAAVSLFHLAADADSGDLIAQRPVELKPRDYAQDLVDRTNATLEAMLVELASAIRSGALPRTPQDHARATWTGKRTPEDGRIDWSASAEAIDRLIRAASRPYPGAFTNRERGELLRVWRCEPHNGAEHVGTIGQVVQVDPDRGALVATGDGLLRLTELTGGVSASPAPITALRVGERLGGVVGAETAVALRSQCEALLQKLNSLADRIDRLENRVRGT